MLIRWLKTQLCKKITTKSILKSKNKWQSLRAIELWDSAILKPKSKELRCVIKKAFFPTTVSHYINKYLIRKLWSNNQPWTVLLSEIMSFIYDQDKGKRKLDLSSDIKRVIKWKEWWIKLIEKVLDTLLMFKSQVLLL